MNAAEAEEILERFAAMLGEHFDAVQILASWNDEGLSYCAKRGTGNWYARQGMAHEFINADIAQENARQLQSVMPNPPKDDDGDQWKES